MKFDFIRLCMIHQVNIKLFYYGNNINFKFFDFSSPITLFGLVDFHGHLHLISDIQGKLAEYKNPPQESVEFSPKKMSPKYSMNLNDQISPGSKRYSPLPIGNPISNHSLTMINSISINMKDFIINNNSQFKNDEAKKEIGTLKFVNEKEKFGFFTLLNDGSDVFFHLEDVVNSGISPEILLNSRGNPNILFQFEIFYYVGKYKQSRKAINIHIMMNNEMNISPYFQK